MTIQKTIQKYSKGIKNLVHSEKKNRVITYENVTIGDQVRYTSFPYEIATVIRTVIYSQTTERPYQGTLIRINGFITLATNFINFEGEKDQHNFKFYCKNIEEWRKRYMSVHRP